MQTKNSTQNMHDYSSNNSDSLQTEILDIQDFTEKQLNNFLDHVTPYQEHRFSRFKIQCPMIRPDINSWRPYTHKNRLTDTQEHWDRKLSDHSSLSSFSAVNMILDPNHRRKQNLKVTEEEQLGTVAGRSLRTLQTNPLGHNAH